MDNTKHAIDEACKLGKGRNSWLVFACSIEHAENAAQCLKDNGISCAVLTGKTPKKERAQLIEGFKNFKYKALVSVSCLTTGFNAKNADYMVCLRPTQSSSLWVQMVGRVMRTHKTKQDGLLADYGGNVERHGPIEDIQPPKKQQGTARKKTCPECGNKCSASAKNCKECNYAFNRTCPTCDQSTPMSEAACTNCGHEFFSERLVAIAETAAKGLDVVSARNITPEWIEVTGVTARRHLGRNGKPDSLRLDYTCGITAYPEWIGIESVGGFRAKAERHYRDAGLTAPNTITEALSGDIPKPTKIMVRKNGKYFDVIGKIF
jgi:DNA repair protein RadD